MAKRCPPFSAAPARPGTARPAREHAAVSSVIFDGLIHKPLDSLCFRPKNNGRKQRDNSENQRGLTAGEANQSFAKYRASDIVATRSGLCCCPWSRQQRAVNVDNPDY